MKDVIKAFKALSDETRLRIICLLQERECCVCEVVQAMEISQTRASRNLNMLYDAGFLKFHKEGLWSLYSIDKDGMPKYFVTMLDSVAKAFAENKVVQMDRQRLKTTQRVIQVCGSCAQSTTSVKA